MRLDSLFSDHMVLQAGKPIRVFGVGAGHVRVSLEGVTAEADVPGPQWCLALPARTYGGPYTLSVSLARQEILLRDVYIGDVYLLAGQSNMQFKLSETSIPKSEWDDQPLLRCFSLARPEEGEPFSPTDGWQVCSRENAGSFSAIGYHLGELCESGRAAGLINCYQGASVIESWLPEDTAASPEFSIPINEKHIDHTWPEYAVWNRNGYLYRHMFAKVPPFALAAAVWYQGESDTSEAEARIYDRELASLAACWRTDLGDASLPFVIVQIADYQPRSDEGWRALQAAQERAAAAIPRAFLIRSADVCDSGSIHPASKARLARRIVHILRDISTDPHGS